jgi:hypothetical protein
MRDRITIVTIAAIGVALIPAEPAIIADNRIDNNVGQRP